MKKLTFPFFLAFLSLMIISCGEDESCTDGIMNGDETGIDCGGSECEPCATCTDGILNGNESDIDCGGDCPACITTVAEDKAQIQKTFDDLLMCTSDFKNSRAVQILFRDFLNMSDGEAMNEDWLEDLGDELEDVVDFEHIDDNSRFDLPYHSGTHQYDSATQTWSKVNNLSNQMIFNFPSSPQSTSNDVMLTIDGYADQQVTIDGEVLYLPTDAHVLMTVGGERTYELTLSDVKYATNADFEIPVEMTAQMFMDPVTIDVVVQRSSTVAYSMDMMVSDGDKCDISVNAEVVLKDDDIENLENDGFESVAVTVSVADLSILTTGDVASLLALDDPTETQFNSLLDLDVLFNNLKIADLEIDEDMESVIIYYKDGTSEDTSVFYKGFWDDVLDLWDEFFG